MNIIILCILYLINNEILYIPRVSVDSRINDYIDNTYNHLYSGLIMNEQSIMYKPTNDSLYKVNNNFR